MGSIQKASHKLGKLLGVVKKTEKKITIEAREKCHNCGKCARVCPFQLEPYLEFSEHNQFDNPNCIKCKTCVANCPAGILSVKKESDALKLKSEVPAKGYENVAEIKARIAEINVLGDDINEYVFGKPASGALPLVLITTTAGTGSEGNSIAVLTNPDSNDKKGMKTPFTYAKASIVDPELMVTLPPRTIAATGMMPCFMPWKLILP
jgi:ferredoxin